MLSEVEAKEAAQSLMSLEGFIMDCLETLQQTEQNKISLLFSRSFLENMLSGYFELINIVEVQNSQFETICLDLLNIGPLVMCHLTEIDSDLKGDDVVDFKDLYTRYAELQSELDNRNMALKALREEFNVPEPTSSTGAQHLKMLTQVDSSSIN